MGALGFERIAGRMQSLLLIRHAKPRIDGDLPSHQWHLSDEGRSSCGHLAGRLRPYRLNRILTSREPKAFETAEAISKILHIPQTIFEGLQEHDRTNVPLLEEDDFNERISQFFECSEELVFGTETAAQALIRFRRAIDHAVNTYTKGNFAIVTHGTVIALFLGERVGLEPMDLWNQLELPSFIVLSVPAFQIVQIVASVADKT